MSIVAATLIVTDALVSALQLASVFSEIVATMNTEGRTELTPEEWDRITVLRKAAVARAMETE